MLTRTEARTHTRAHTHILKHQTPSSSSGSSSIFHTLHRLIWLNGLFRRCVLRGRCVCVRRLQVVQLDGIMTTRRPHPAHAWNVLDLTCSGHQALTQSPDACTSSAPAALFHKSACYVVSFDVNAEVKWPACAPICFGPVVLLQNPCEGWQMPRLMDDHTLVRYGCMRSRGIPQCPQLPVCSRHRRLKHPRLSWHGVATPE